MSRVWYCANCGYEVGSRGKCHSCGERLTASALPLLEAGDEDDEVGYRLETWEDEDRGRLIEELNREEILHRFEEDELIVAAEDEERVDDLIASVTETAAKESAAPTVSGTGAVSGAGGVGAAGGAGGSAQPATETALRLLHGACVRLRQDPTDMVADGDVAEASTGVFMSDGYPGADEEEWAAVGRVTRRLLAALGSEEALEGEIRTQAGVLQKLLAPLIDADAPPGATDPVVSVPAPAAAPDDLASSDGVSGPADDEGGLGEGPGDTVYELTEWLPEERAQLDVLMDEAGIRFEWDGDELLVPSDRESEVELLFEQVRGGSTEEDDETRYRAMEELFAATVKLVNDPADEQRRADTAARISDVIGPPPFGFDEVQWLRIMKLSRALAQFIEDDADILDVHDTATELRDLLRSVV